MNNSGVFSGKNSLKDFLNPDNHPFTPLVELPESLNPFLKKKVRIFAKLMYFLPLLNIKSLPALNMLLDAEKNGRLKGVSNIIENSSGNTAFSLAIIAPAFGIKKVFAVVSPEIAQGKLNLLKIAGAKIIFSKAGGIEYARRKGGENDFFNPGQYENEANPKAMEKWLAPQIWKQTKGEVSVFSAGLGTTGTMIGTGRYLKKKNPEIKTVGVNCAENNAIPGVRTMEKLKEISFDWKPEVDYRLEANEKESFKKSIELCRSGLLAGPSSGFVFAGLLNFLKSQEKINGLNKLKNKNGEVVSVFVCPDTPLPYLDKYNFK